METEKQKLFRERWGIICPKNTITLFSCVVPTAQFHASHPAPSISDCGFPDDLRDFIRENKWLAEMHRQHQESVWGFQGGTCSKIESPFHRESACLLYYEMGPGMVRGSYDALWLALSKLNHRLHQAYPWSEMDRINIKFPYSVRSGMDRDIFDVIVKKTLPESHYSIVQ
jgi:hypothetical protein